MNAEELTRALGGRWRGSSGSARCPGHSDKSPSLSIRDGDGDTLLTHCHAGCSPEAVWSALVDQGLAAGQNGYRTVRGPTSRRVEVSAKSRRRDLSDHQSHALDLWRASRNPIGTLTATYLHHRAVIGAIPATIRDHPGLKHGPTGLNLPAMVAAITGADRKVVAIQRTFLRVDGRGKANVSTPKLTLGAMGAGAVRLGPGGSVLGIAEGVETGLSAMVLFGLPAVWCSLSASRLDRLWLPAEALEVHVFADNGTAGHEAGERAVAAYQGQGRRVVVRFPPEQFGDWNDVLAAGVQS